MLSRRTFIGAAAGAPLVAIAAGQSLPAPSGAALKSLTADAKAISGDERHARLAKLQDLMQQRKVAAFLVESGSSLEYFTGIRWARSERVTLAIIPARGEVIVVTPAFEEPSVRGTLQVGGDVRPWNEHENPSERIVQGLRDRGIASGYWRWNPLFGTSSSTVCTKSPRRMTSSRRCFGACRLIKSPAELALLQVANNVTLEALRSVRASRARHEFTDLAALVDRTTVALGGSEFSLVLLNEASAYPRFEAARPCATARLS
jgi:Xaa-Pro dipeptidase